MKKAVRSIAEIFEILKYCVKLLWETSKKRL